MNEYDKDFEKSVGESVENLTRLVRTSCQKREEEEGASIISMQVQIESVIAHFVAELISNVHTRFIDEDDDSALTEKAIHMTKRSIHLIQKMLEQCEPELMERFTTNHQEQSRSEDQSVH